MLNVDQKIPFQNSLTSKYVLNNQAVSQNMTFRYIADVLTKCATLLGNKIEKEKINIQS